MSSVDTRVVEMKFNNNQFESGIKSVMGSLRALKSSLKLDGATKGINDISAATKGVNFSGMAAGVDNISSKFTAFGAIGFSILQNLTKSVMTFGSNVLSKILDPLIEGGKRRALTIEQAKFQFEGLGMDVEKSMESARLAVTGTAYGLEDAAKAASMFGASGMRAGTEMTSSLRAIAGVAAMTGSSYSDIADVFTSVSGNGRVMGSDLLRLSSRGVNAAATLAKSMGKTEAEVRDMVTKGKVSFEMFSDAMDGAFGKHATAANKTYVGALANMKAALSRIGADVATVSFENQRKVLNALAPVIDDVHDALKPLIKLFGELQGKSSRAIVTMLKGLDMSVLTKSMGYIVSAIKSVLSALSAVFGPVKMAFKEIFPPATAETIIGIARAIASFAADLKVGTDASRKLFRTFRGVFALFDIGFIILRKIAIMFGDLFRSATAGSGGILDFTASTGDFISKIRDAVRSGTFLNNFFRVLTATLTAPIVFLRVLGAAFGDLFKNMKGVDTGGLSGLGKKLQTIFKPFTVFGDIIQSIWEKIGGAIMAFWNFVAPAVKWTTDQLSKLGETIGEALRSLDSAQVVDALKTGGVAAAILLFRNMFNKFFGLFTAESAFTYMNQIKYNLIGLSNSLKVVSKAVAAGTLLMIAAAVLLLAVAMDKLAKIPAKKLLAAGAAMAFLFKELAVTMKFMETTMNTASAAKMVGIAAGMVLLAIAVDILASAVKKLSDLKWNELAKGLVGVTVLMGALTVAARGMSNVKGLPKTAAGIILLAIGIKILASAVKDLSDLGWEEMAKGLVGVGLLLGALTLFTKFSGADKGGMLQGAGIVLLAIGIKILASALKDFASMSWEEIGKGLAAMAGGLVLMGVALALIPPSSILSAAAILVVASSLGLIADALSAMGGMSWDEIGKGLVTLAGALVLIAGALLLLPPSSLLSAAAIFVVATSLQLVAAALAVMGAMSWEEIAKGLIMLAGSLGIIALAMYAMTAALPGAAAMVVVAAALTVLLPVLTAFSVMSWEEMGKGLLMLAGVFIVLGIAGLVLTPIVPTLLGLGLAIGLLGVGMLAAGGGLVLFSVGLTALAAAGAAAVVAIVAIVSGLIGLIPMVMQQIGLGIVAFAAVIANSASAIVKAIVTVLVALIDGIVRLTPKVVGALMKMLFIMINAIVQAVPRLVQAGFTIIRSILDGIARNIGRVITSATNIIVNFINGISRALPRIIQAGVNLILSFVNGLTRAINQNSRALGVAGGNLAKAMVRGMASGLLGGVSTVVNAAKQVASRAFEAAKSFLKINSPSKKFAWLGMGMDEGMGAGLDEYSHIVTKAATGVGHEAIDSMKKSISGVSDLISGDLDMTPVIRPVLDLTDVRKGSLKIGSMMISKPITVGASYSSAKDASAGYQNNQTALAQLGGTGLTQESLTFIQNNNSPKALSSADIYRQTKNQLSVAKGALTK